MNQRYSMIAWPSMLFILKFIPTGSPYLAFFPDLLPLTTIDHSQPEAGYELVASKIPYIFIFLKGLTISFMLSLRKMIVQIISSLYSKIKIHEGEGVRLT